MKNEGVEPKGTTLPSHVLRDELTLIRASLGVCLSLCQGI